MKPDVEEIAHILALVRGRKPVVHAITNWVTAGDVAGGLTALGARPVLAVAEEEVREIVARADALMLNLGTPTPDRVEAMLAAGRQANTSGKPVVFDPVGAGVSPFRREASGRILSEVRCSVIKGNRAEIGSLAGMGGELRGIEAVAGPEDLQKAATGLSEQTGAVIAVSGQHDVVVRGERIVTVENGHPLLGRVTGSGCMLAAVIAAFLAVHEDALMATVAGTAFFGLAGEWAGQRSEGPGSFKAALMDALFALSPEDLRAGARVRG